MKGLAGKIAVVTGAATGIGQAIAVRLAAEGCNLLLNYNSEAPIETQSQALAAAERSGHPIMIVSFQADVSDAPRVEEMFAFLDRELGAADILINNAGIHIAAPAHLATLEDIERVFAVNVRGTILCAQQFLRRQVEAGKRGCIVNLSSIHEIVPKPNYLSYSASRGATGNITRTLALEYARHGIRINAIAPGATVTPINKSWVDVPEKRAEVERHIPLGRAGEAHEMAAAAAFLCSSEAEYITGQTLFIDGGLTLYADFAQPWSSE